MSSATSPSPETVTQRYRVHGMHCGGCVAKVTEAIQGLPEVRAARVSLESETASVESSGQVASERLVEAVRRAGDYQLEPIAEAPLSRAATAERPTATDSAGQPPESLYPLFLIVGYLLGVVVLVAAATGGWQLEPMMRHFMAGFFLIFSFFKLLDPPGFVSAYRMYDLIAARVPAWGWAYPMVELGLGVAYLLALAPLLVNSVTLVLMLVGAAGVLRALQQRQAIRCACLGTALNLPMTKVTLIEDLTMAAMAAAMLLMHAL